MKYIFIFLNCCLFFFCQAQDSTYGRSVIKELSGEKYWGRGYTKNGMELAAKFIAAEFKTIGLSPAAENYLQELEFPANTFPGKMSLKLNGKLLTAGKDFVVAPESGPIKAKGRFDAADSAMWMSREQGFVLMQTEKLSWSASREKAPYAAVHVLTSSIPQVLKNFEAEIENEFILNFSAYNVAGFVKGTSQPDSFVLITAHYDHLGGMGSEVFFPGANDNASGVAMMLSMAKYYAKNPQRYTIVFIAFAGEEIGLVGSKFYTENPLFPLEKTRFVINLDLEGNGSDGVTVVNATEFPTEYSLLHKQNHTHQFLKAINQRGKAANSDHYFFSEKGVPAFFIYTLGGSSAYHDIYDVEHNLKLEEFVDLQKLLFGFISDLMNNNN